MTLFCYRKRSILSKTKLSRWFFNSSGIYTTVWISCFILDWDLMCVCVSEISDVLSWECANFYLFLQNHVWSQQLLVFLLPQSGIIQLDFTNWSEMKIYPIKVWGKLIKWQTFTTQQSGKHKLCGNGNN